jgi:predicted RNA binding protein YcfA (HicA-like mRNA interferase family)
MAPAEFGQDRDIRSPDLVWQKLPFVKSAVGVYNTHDAKPRAYRELIKLLQADGWQLKRTRGSHHQFAHPTKPGTVTVPHPKKDLGKGLLQAIRKQAGLK